MTTENGTKALAPDAAIRRSVIETDETKPIAPSGVGLLFFMAGVADEITAWGTNPTWRDRQLREFVLAESFLSSAMATVVARNMAFSWKLDGPESTIARVQDVLLSANQGKGWENFVAKLSLDLYGQDKAAFIELVREEDSPRAPVIGINSLDAAQCWHTRNTDWPVLYQNIKGRWIPLRWYQVIPLAEMPASSERLPGLQISAMTRVLRMAQIMRNIAVYYDEKTGGRSPRSVHILHNVSAQAVQDVIAKKQIIADSQGLMRYLEPVFAETFDPQQKPEVVTLDIANIPDGFKIEEMNKWYLTAIAMGFLEDYQTFAPLPGGNLGTSAQSQVLHAKARGKGPGLFMKLMSHAFNFQGITPRNVTFSWDEQDLEADEMQATLVKTRAEARKLMLENGEIDFMGARQLALDAGDIPQELFDAMNQRDLTPGPARDDARVDDEEEAQKARLGIPKASGVDEERRALEEEINAKMSRGFAKVRRMIEERLKE